MTERLTQLYLQKENEVYGPTQQSALVTIDGQTIFSYGDHNYIYDIASITKVLVTTQLSMIAVEEKLIQLTTPCPWRPSITFQELLSHTAGLVAWWPCYLYKSETPNTLPRDEFLEILNLSEKSHFVGHHAPKKGHRLYSDLGFMLLGYWLEDIFQQKTSNLYEDLIIQNIKKSPWWHQDCFCNYLGQNTQEHLANKTTPIIPSSHGNPYEKKLSQHHKKNDQFLWRNYQLHGEVNDANAHYCFAGKAPHAGLFANTHGLYAFYQAIKNNLLTSQVTQDLFFHTIIDGNSLGYAHHSNQLKIASPHALYGHHGFTGTSFIFSRDQDICLIYLSNRQAKGIDKNHNYPDWKHLLQSTVDFCLK